MRAWSTAALVVVTCAAMLIAAAAEPATKPVGTDLSGPLFFGILPPACYDSLLLNWNFDVACIKFAVSKGLGYAIIAGSFLLKAPQIFNLVRAKSEDGLILSALYLETLSYAASSSYNAIRGSPLSTYAEGLVILAQNIIIAVLCWHYGRTGAGHRITASAALVVAAAVFLSLPSAALPLLMALSVATSMSSRVKQIAANYSAGSTGILSLATTLLQTGGCAARIFTTLQEVDDIVVLGSFVVAFVLNAIVLLQIFLYWGRAPAKSATAAPARSVTATLASPKAVKTSTKSKSVKAD
jgi:mannose-P-dolichol utilization defect protein 1